MQFLIKLKRESEACQFALNYQYQLSAALEGILEKADFSKLHLFLNDKEEFVRYIPFTFSHLDLDQIKIIEEKGSLVHLGEEGTLDIRILLEDDAIDYLYQLIYGKSIRFNSGESFVDYKIVDLEVIPPPVFKSEMVYSAVTPVFLYDQSQSGGFEFISPSHDRYSELFKNDLLKRFVSVIPELKSITELEKYCPEIEFQPISQAEEEEIVLNMYQYELVHLKGFKYDFKLKASPLLQEFGYYAGFGAQNSLGFGCVNVK
ncbi:CRISPR-associated endoribonuclease Cas6 [Belliella baltica DSM 15883]|uniref:CRISPR-associated endoribonuclease Cas6 n=1 Tax=Belliella baltica (strain DSM 15883 / CIP 108006 / LMG 21964 / BA134) TaxID=866536 RepID=I3Z8Z1_BELBD|nr:CRISPR-associated endoribonuclease Cas6 [Belliella baltica]AFL85709.1 CRISPR-associated endoribonuclease Cas6 [Belliella baltica DSM 15883]